jgi:predicted transposase YdaD
VEEVSAELSTVTAAADKVYRINEPLAWLLHMEFQAGRDPVLPQRLLKYNVLLHDRFELPTHSAVVLLRPAADAPNLTGTLRYQRADLGGIDFTYRVVRVWEWPVEELLAGGLGTLPLAPLSAQVTEAQLPGLIQRMDERLHGVEASEAGKLWTATYILSGLRFPKELTAQLLRGVQAMKESVTYQAIIEEGEAKGLLKGARLAVLRIGEKRLGPPDEPMKSALASIGDLERLLRMSERVPEVKSWAELLATP